MKSYINIISVRKGMDTFSRKTRRIMKKIMNIYSSNSEQKLFVTSSDSKDKDNKLNSIKFVSKEGLFRGVFFRSPLLEVTYENDCYFDNNYSKSLYEVTNKYMDSKLFRFYFNLIGNRRRMIDCLKAMEKDNDNSLGGWRFYNLVSPIYFSRVERKTACYYYNIDKEGFLDKKLPYGEIFAIISEGYEDKFETVGGHCHKEITKVYDFYGRRIQKIINKKSYHFTYEHYSKSLIKASNENSNYNSNSLS